MEKPILIALPPREGFSPEAFGAISLCVRDFTQHSAYRDRITVLGTVDAPAFEGVNYVPFPIKRRWYEPFTRSYARAIARHAKAHNAALIEVHNRPLLAWFLLRMQDVPVALHLHNDPQEMRIAKCARKRAWLAKHCSAIYCVSHYIRDRFCDKLTDTDSVHVVHNGLRIPAELSVQKQKQILYVGRMTPNKGGLVFAQALADLLVDYPDWKGVMIGGRRHCNATTLSRYQKQVRHEVERAHGRIECRGFCEYETTLQATREAAIAVVPSLWNEPFGRTALEAMAKGCALVTTGRGGLSEVVGDAGLLYPDGTASALKTQLKTLLDDADALAAAQAKSRLQAQRCAIATVTKDLDMLRAKRIDAA